MDDPLRVLAGSPDKPLVIGGIRVPCYVLEGEICVITQVGVLSSMARTHGGKTFMSSNSDCDETPIFTPPKWLKSFMSKELTTVTKVRFMQPHGGIAYGYPAMILEELCRAVLDADQAGVVTRRQAKIVERAWVLFRGFARVGIISLVHETTGYQRNRSDHAMADILENFIAKNMRTWTKTFPDEFYEEICRLKNWPRLLAYNRPGEIGRITNYIVYERLAPWVLEELQRLNPWDVELGGRKNKHHQFLSEDLGHPKLHEHLVGVMALMRSCDGWREFEMMLWRSYPSYRDTQPLRFPVAEQESA